MSLPMHISESGDEGLGSMSPEPLSVITVSADGHAVSGSGEVAELKRQLERERVARTQLEKQLRSIQMFPERFRDEQLLAYQPHEVISIFALFICLFIYLFIYLFTFRPS